MAKKIEVVTIAELKTSVATLGEMIQNAHTERHTRINERIQAYVTARNTFEQVVAQATSDYETATHQVCQASF